MPRTRLACLVVLSLPALAVADDVENGLKALDKQDYREALACFDRAVKDNPRNAVAYNGRGRARYHLKEYVLAIGDYREAIRLNPDYAEAYSNRGVAHDARKDHDKAIADYTHAIRLDPTYVSAYVNRGLSYEARKDYEKAVEDFEKAIRIAPNHPSAHDNLAWLLAACPRDKVRDGRRAVEHARRSCELTAYKDADCLDTLAAAYAESGDFKEAVRWEKKSLELGEGDGRRSENLRRQRLRMYEKGEPFRL